MPGRSSAGQLHSDRRSFTAIPKAFLALRHCSKQNHSLIDIITAASCLPNERSRRQLAILQRFLVRSSPALAACPAWQQLEFARVAELHEFESGQVVSLYVSVAGNNK